jgi:hypothetical protein
MNPTFILGNKSNDKIVGICTKFCFAEGIPHLSLIRGQKVLGPTSQKFFSFIDLFAGKAINFRENHGKYTSYVADRYSAVIHY